MKSLSPILLFLLLSTGCATARGRFLIGAGIGSLAAGGTATYLSPNPESRGLNALVFGLLGAVVGGTVGLLTYNEKIPAQTTKLQEKEQLRSLNDDSKLYEVAPQQQLPAFIKERLQPAIIEEFVERDTVSEDGSLHEPHRVYRIRRQAELFSDPSKLQIIDGKVQ